MNLVIVESPAKAKTINKYLGSKYTVLASYGHIRDLPSKNGSVDPENDFKMIWEVDSFSKKYLKEITDSAKKSTKIKVHQKLPKTTPISPQDSPRSPQEAPRGSQESPKKPKKHPKRLQKHQKEPQRTP